MQTKGQRNHFRLRLVIDFSPVKTILPVGFECKEEYRKPAVVAKEMFFSEVAEISDLRNSLLRYDVGMLRPDQRSAQSITMRF